MQPASRAHENVIVRGGAYQDVQLCAGDRVTIRDPEGGQVCELRVTGAGDPLGLGGNKRLLGTAPGDQITLLAAADCQARLAAPGAMMRPDAHDAPGDLCVTIERQTPVLGPQPLAAIQRELVVKAATAQAYHVAAGDYIQIIDLEGKQCADFLAFDAVALAAGDEYGLECTTTRSLNGRIYPGPGLYARFFDERMLPLVEVVQDTVGRHDMFGLACNAKSYDDAGYPGHANCTDNFNLALAAHDISPRAGWPAINFFYNTALDAAGAIIADEPWSRPGDYVLLRALRDLLCATSSCADDVGVTNGFQPTDIMVRIYDGVEPFAKGAAQRMTADGEARLTRQSGFHAATAKLTRNFTPYNGFFLPDSYTNAGAVAEYWACRERAALIDLSALRKFEITGPDAETLLNLAATRNIRKLATGQVVYTAFCYEHGGMIDDGTVMRFGPDNFRLVCGADYTGIWLRELAAAQGLRALVRSSTDQLHNLALQGPLARRILAPLIFTPPLQPPIEALPWFRFSIGRLGGEQGIPLVISRTGYTGELGYEIWCHPAQAVAVWEAITAAGAEPMGLAALEMLRVEAGLILAGHEFSDQTDPFEAGIGFAVAEKTEAFIGQAALQRRRAHPQAQLVGLVMRDNETVQHGDGIHLGRARIGVVTSAVRSPLLGKTIALARVDAHHAALGTAVEIARLDGLQKRLTAEIVAFPHYDPGKTRVRA